MLPGRLSQLPPSSFAMLATLLDPHQPGQTPISLAVGDPRGATPAFVMEALNKHAAEFGEYPPINGTQAWRNAAAGWITRRFGVAVDPEKEILPLNGTRE
ncbi:MAG TPA: aminotransferase class I/II-fold pyridoxal phosphate-dependent enzyme, partial [Rhizomicrobium sp.]|nr:aminotransferase class I/II-fold pyridoxal phosphate-dependent enzyme [Rhizomicrobium sp.]